VDTTDELSNDASINEALESLFTQQAAEPTAQAEDTYEEEAEEAEYEEVDESEVQEEEVDELGDDEGEEIDEEEAEEDFDTYTVKVDGKEYEVTLEELKRGYSGQEFIQKGMSEVAEQRKTFSDKLKLAEQTNALLEQAKQYQMQLNQRQQQPGFGMPPTPPDESLIETDFVAYNQAEARYRRELQEYQEAVQLQQQTEQYVQHAQEQAQRAYVSEQLETLKTEIPEFANPETAPAARDRILRTAEKFGFTAEEIAGVTDARTIRILHRFSELLDVEAGADKAIKDAKPKPKRVVKAGAKKRQNRNKKQQDARARMKKSGSMNDALEYLFS